MKHDLEIEKSKSKDEVNKQPRAKSTPNLFKQTLTKKSAKDLIPTQKAMLTQQKHKIKELKKTLKEKKTKAKILRPPKDIQGKFQGKNLKHFELRFYY